jgi:hypothetical protein
VEEKRHYRRIPFEVEITCTPAEGAAFTAQSKDVSLGGMFIASKENPAFGTQMSVRVHFPGQKSPFELPCVVRWNLADGFGVQFGLLGARETHAITRLE